MPLSPAPSLLPLRSTSTRKAASRLPSLVRVHCVTFSSRRVTSQPPFWHQPARIVWPRCDSGVVSLHRCTARSGVHRSADTTAGAAQTELGSSRLPPERRHYSIWLRTKSCAAHHSVPIHGRVHHSAFCVLFAHCLRRCAPPLSGQSITLQHPGSVTLAPRNLL